LESYYKTADGEWYKQRLNGAMLCVLAAFAVLIIRLFYLQVVEGDEYRRLSESNCIRLKSIDAPRGLIFDRHRNLLVDNRPSFDLSIILKDAKPLDRTVEKLSRLIDMPEEDLHQSLAKYKGLSAYKPILLESDMGRDTLAAIEVQKFNLPGVVVSVKPRRHYLFHQSASHLLGYLSQINVEELKSNRYAGCRSGDFVGKFGIEKTYQDFLTGKRGGQQVEVDVTGQVVRVIKNVPAVPGHNILLTIDSMLQQKAESLLDGLSGAIVAMDPATGHILALASGPSFDQNDFVSGMSSDQWNSLVSNPKRPMSNRAVQGLYPPASTYKIVTAMAGLEEKVIDTETTYFCPGHYRYGNRVFRCWKRGGHGDVNVVDALAKSCDVFFYQVGEELGIDRLAWYANACGLGKPTGIKLDHEAAGLVPTAAWKKRRTGVSWQGGETLSVAIGQGFNLTTPLQMLGLTAAVGNNGTRLRPQVMKAIETVEGKVVKTVTSEELGVLPASKETLAIIKQGLWEVVNNRRGTAWIAHVDGLDISGKTGTAQVVSRQKGEPDIPEEEVEEAKKPHAWFVAYAPSVSPKIAIAIMVEHGEHGSSACGPIAREMIKLYLADEIAENKAKETAQTGTGKENFE